MMKLFLVTIAAIFILTNAVYPDDKTGGSSTFPEIHSFRNQVFENIPDATKYYVHGTSKCGVGIFFEMMENWDRLSPSQQEQYKILSSPLRTDTNRVIGRFIIYYDTSGISAPSLLDANGNPIPNSAEAYVDSVGKIFNYVWNYEIDSLGYSPPPFEQRFSYYRIFISELYASSLYGRTQPTDLVWHGTPRRYASFIEIDNDFRYFYSRGMDGLKVTAAHEFHHAIQLGSYGEWSSDYYFYEITSTWMEDVVYTEVNDYYQYLFTTPNNFRASQFSEPELSFVSSERGIEYSRAVWGKYIEKRFSPNVMRSTWEYMRQTRSVQSLDYALRDVGSKMREALIEYSIWNAQAGPNCDTTTYYTEGKQYPPMYFKAVVQYEPPSRSIIDSIQSMAASYHPILVNGNTMLAMIMNVHIASSVPSQYVSFTYDISQSDGVGYKRLSNGLYTKLTTSNPENWYSVETVPTIVDDVVVYPNPMYSNQTRYLKFRLPIATSPSATLDIFSASLRHIFSDELPIVNLKPFEPGVIWNGNMDDGEEAPSGIYIFILKEGEKEYKGKFSILRN